MVNPQPKKGSSMFRGHSRGTQTRPRNPHFQPESPLAPPIAGMSAGLNASPIVPSSSDNQNLTTARNDSPKGRMAPSKRARTPGSDESFDDGNTKKQRVSNTSNGPFKGYFWCDLCDFKTRELWLLQEHYNWVHEIFPRMPCPECKEETRDIFGCTHRHPHSPSQLAMKRTPIDDTPIPAPNFGVSVVERQRERERARDAKYASKFNVEPDTSFNDSSLVDSNGEEQERKLSRKDICNESMGY